MGVRKEAVWLLAILVVWSLANLLTISRLPPVWQDEVMLADPAVNYLQGNGWTSTAWPYQSGSEFWAGNAPLHSLLLVPWLSVFGISPTAVRSINLVYMTGFVLVLWLFIRRAGLLRSPSVRLLAVVLVLCGFGTTFNYRSGRYDCLGMLVVAAMAWAWSWHQPFRRRSVVIFLLSALVPFTGIQLMPLIALGLFALAFVEPWARTWRFALALGLGMAAGGLALLLFFAWHGALQGLIATSAHVVGARREFLSVLSLARGMLSRIDLEKLASFDPSLTVVTLVLAGGILVTAWRGRLRAVRGALVAVVLIFGLLVFILLTRRWFPIYYSWMAFVPLVIVTLWLWEPVVMQKSRWKVPLELAFCAAVVLGLPAHLWTVVLQWNARDYDRVERFVAGVHIDGTTVLSDWAAYYALKRPGRVVLLPNYLQHLHRLTPLQRRRVTVIVVRRSNRGKLLRSIGGAWEQIAHIPPPQRSRWSSRVRGAGVYDLVALRRLPQDQSVASASKEWMVNEDVSHARTLQAAGSITVGPGVSLKGPSGNLVVRSGTTIVFRNGFSVAAGARLTAATSPALSRR